MKPDHPIPFANYGLFEALKAQWRDQHPAATPAEYQAAVRGFAERCGV